MLAIYLLWAEIAIPFCIGVTNPHVEKGRTLLIPKPASMHIKVSIKLIVITITITMIIMIMMMIIII